MPPPRSNQPEGTGEAQWTIGQLAAATGVPTSKIRYWERKGLLATLERSGDSGATPRGSPE